MKTVPAWKNYFRWMSRWLLTSAFLVVFFFGVRLIALFYYGSWQVLLQDHKRDLFAALWMGTRFDGVVLSYGLILPLLSFLVWIFFASKPAAWIMTIFGRCYFVFWVFVVTTMTLGDLGYYSYFQDHFNILVFGFFEDDTMALIHTMWKNYPVIPIFLLTGLFIAGLIYLSTRLFRVQDWDLNDKALRPVMMVIFLASIPLVGLGGRGSIGLFPLHEMDATISPDPFLNYLSYSGLHAFFRASKVKYQNQRVWNTNGLYYGYNNWQDAAKDFFDLKTDQIPSDPIELIAQTTPKNTWAEKTKPHVVMILMESWGGYWLRWDSPQFNIKGEMARHFKEDFTFMNFLPSMTATIGSLSALMVNSPHRPEGNFLTESRYMQVPFRFAPSFVYKKAGYKTRFIYGGGIGWRSVDRFARVQGYDSAEGDVMIERKLGRPLEKHDWGVFDEDLFEYLEITLKEATEPEFVFVLTTTNHPPYQIPKDYKPKPIHPPEELQKQFISDKSIVDGRFRVFQYSNQKLGEFMTRLKASPLGEKTIVGATGDHGFLLINFKDTDLLQKWQVPFYLYLPPGARQEIAKRRRPHEPLADLSTFGSHTDIFPTLFDVSLSNVTHYSFGASLLDKKKNHQAYYYQRLAINKEGAIIADKTPVYLHWDPAFEQLKTGAATPGLETLYKKYSSLMGLMDYFYDFELKASQATKSQPLAAPSPKTQAQGSHL